MHEGNSGRSAKGDAGTAGERRFWIFGTRPRNAIHRSKNHFLCHTSFLGMPGKPGGFARAVFQIGSNLRHRGHVPKIGSFGCRRLGASCAALGAS